ncbi:MAG: sigma-70 family RNA polymerase sigma factor [Caulobacteraceae bacterium]|nr:sigma-70 family RNA polymerase sigma factor [Caulobacteraceae bacterium]
MSDGAIFVSSFRDDVIFSHDPHFGSHDGNIRNIGAGAHQLAPPDEELCGRLKRGDQAALRSLMDRHAPMVLRLAMNVLSDRGDAEDVVQEVFISVWRRRESWVAVGAKFSTWLHRVAINKAIDKRRSRRSTPESAEYINAVCDAVAAREVALDQSSHVDRVDTARKLDGEISRLPETQARALRYFYFEGRDVAAIAVLMGGTEQSVRSLLKRGRQALRARLVRRRKSSDDAFAVRGLDRPLRTGRR